MHPLLRDSCREKTYVLSRGNLCTWLEKREKARGGTKTLRTGDKPTFPFRGEGTKEKEEGTLENRSSVVARERVPRSEGPTFFAGSNRVEGRGPIREEKKAYPEGAQSDLFDEDRLALLDDILIERIKKGNAGNGRKAKGLTRNTSCHNTTLLGFLSLLVRKGGSFPWPGKGSQGGSL